MKVLIAGGGTGGHIYPGVAIAKELKEKDSKVEILFVGTENGLENKIVPKEGFNLKTIRSRGFNRKAMFDNFKTLTINILGLQDAYRIVSEFKPNIAIGTGGYVTGPVILICSLMNIKTIIHESNVIPGVTNKILSIFVNIIALSYEDTKKYLKGVERKIIVTGNPVRKDLFNYNKIESKHSLGFDAQKPLIVSVGGSRGASNINRAVLNYLQKFLPADLQFLFITGENQYENITKQIDISAHKNVKIIPYAYNMPLVYAAADLIICRAGAMTISELAACAKPSILIPSPFVAENHQEYNARALEKVGAAKVILEKDLNEDILRNYINEVIYNREKLKEMGEKARSISKPDALSEIIKLIYKLIGP
ncbi:MAG: undecaprenyldiphospho-muramoylpentapeptide beta-N-acetylglucosaminyltransferase [Thermoanaerobacteraceae bacterium]|nr:undecaprenyldiphospho-muramoylpentapeptide beta-N-acetylglucosaminyltransferase [Thermoanaerobacteraceae bacterium]